MSIYGSASKTQPKLMFQPITSPTPSRRPQPKPKSKPEQRAENDKKSMRKETEIKKIDPLTLMSKQEIDDMSKIGLQMYLNALELCASESGFKTVIRNIQRLGLGVYIDDAFRPCLKSLVGDNLINKSPWRAFTWLRPDEFSKEPASIFGFSKDKIEVSPNDVEQGQLIGDGYLIAALASLAYIPERIRKIFSIYEEDPLFGKEHGVYAINLYLAGHPFEMVLDDYFPCISAEKGSAFAKVINGKLWPVMIEKAWAKMNFSYDNIEVGRSSDVLRDLTGAPVKSTWTDEDPEAIWKELKEAHKLRYPMTASSNNFNKGLDYINEDGIVSNHAYSCLGGTEVTKSNGEKVRLVKLRSVFPSAIFKGKWSINSPEWNDVPNKEKYLTKLKKGGIMEFYMDFENFKKSFDYYSVCRANDSFQYSYLTKKFNRKVGEYFKIVIEQEGRYYFAVSQEPMKRYSKAYSDKNDYAETKLCLGRLIEKGELGYIEGKKKYEFIKATQFGKKDVWITHDRDVLPKGEYILYAKVIWPAFDEKEATASVYGTAKCRIDDELNFQYKDWLENLWLDYGRKKGTKISLKDQGAPNSEYCAEKTTDGFGLFAVWNKESDKKLLCEFRLKNSSELKVKFKETFNKKDIAVFEVLPGEAKIALVGVNKYYAYGEIENTTLYHSCTIKALPL